MAHRVSGEKKHHCLRCGNVMQFGVAEGDDRSRHFCAGCGFIHFEGPRILVMCLLSWEDKMLLMRRATDPGKGGWTAPGGFVELDESPRQAAARELREEVGVGIDPDSLSLFMVGSLGPMDQVYLLYRGCLPSPDHELGPEASEIGFFKEAEFPWEELAFKAAPDPINAFYRDLARGEFGVYHDEVFRDGRHVFERVR